MGRIRTIKPELREHLPFASLTDRAVRLFVGVITLADDNGRFPASPSYLAGAIFFARPCSVLAIGKAKAELETAQLVHFYAVNGAPFGEIVDWASKGAVTYQRIEKHQGGRFPGPDSVRSGNDSAPRSATDSGIDLRSPISEREDEVEGEGEGEPFRNLPPLSSSPLEDLKQGFEALFEKHHGAFPTWRPLQEQQGGELLEQHSVQEILRRAAIMFDWSEDYPTGRDFDTLVRFIDTFVSDGWTGPVSKGLMDMIRPSTYPAHRPHPSNHRPEPERTQVADSDIYIVWSNAEDAVTGEKSVDHYEQRTPDGTFVRCAPPVEPEPVETETVTADDDTPTSDEMRAWAKQAKAGLR